MQPQTHAAGGCQPKPRLQLPQALIGAPCEKRGEAGAVPLRSSLCPCEDSAEASHAAVWLQTDCSVAMAHRSRRYVSSRVWIGCSLSFALKCLSALRVHTHTRTHAHIKHAAHLSATFCAFCLRPLRLFPSLLFRLPFSVALSLSPLKVANGSFFSLFSSPLLSSPLFSLQTHVHTHAHIPTHTHTHTCDLLFLFL